MAARSQSYTERSMMTLWTPALIRPDTEALQAGQRSGQVLLHRRQRPLARLVAPRLPSGQPAPSWALLPIPMLRSELGLAVGTAHDRASCVR